MVGKGSGSGVKVGGPAVSDTQRVPIEEYGKERAEETAEEPDPELRPRAGRRRFTKEYKLRMLAEADRCAKGELGSLLRREGLYSSHLTDWRRQRESGLLVSGKGRVADDLQEARRALAHAQRENRRLQERLERAETIISVQKNCLRCCNWPAGARELMWTAVAELAATTGIQEACAALGVSRASYYRQQRPRPRTVRRTAPPAWALSAVEVAQVLEVLHSERFVDLAPSEIAATLLDEGVYLCSERTMYRLLAEHGEVQERRAQARRMAYAAPELLATGPNQVWSWDISKLKGPGTWNYFCLYVILDIYSRYVTGWCVATRESADLASDLIAQACDQQGIPRGQLTLHADRGSSMTSKTVSQLLLDLDVVRTHSRPHVSNDNPFSEAQFKTFKYRPGFRTASARRRVRASTAGTSSAGTTPSTVTRASAC